MVKYKAWNQNNLKSSLWHEKLKKKTGRAFAKTRND